MCTSEVRTATAGCLRSTPGGLGKGRGQPCSAPALLCLPRPAGHSHWAAAWCGHSGKACTRGTFPRLPGPLPAGPGVVQLPLRRSRLLEPWSRLPIPPVTASFVLCVASEQPAGRNYGLRVFRAVAADQHYSRLTHKGQGIFFFFPVQFFGLELMQWTGSAA